MKNPFFEKIERIVFIYSLLKPYRVMFWLLMALMILAAVWEGVVLVTAATMFQTLIDRTKFSLSTFDPDSFMGSLYSYFIKIPDEYHLVAGFAFTTISILIGVFINASLHTFQTGFSTRFIIHVRSEIFSKLYRSPLSYFDEQKKGDLLAMVVTESRSCYAIVKNFIQLLIFLLKTLVLFGVLNAISLELTLIVAIISAIFLAETTWIARILRRLSEKYVEKNRAMTVDVEESLQGVKLVKLFNLHNIMESSFRKNCSISEFTNRKQAVIIQWQTVVSNVFMIASVLAIITTNVIYSFTVISLMLTFLYTLQKFYGALLGINKAYGVLNKEVPSLDRVIEFFKKHEVFFEKCGDLVREKLLDKKLSFKGVFLQYESGGTDKFDLENNILVLDNIDLDIYKGETIALVGESGSGKTSLVNLIVRLYDPSKGQIMIDGIKIQEFNLKFLRKNIGMVSQDTILFNKTIRENIMFGSEEASEEEMIKAAKNAHVHKFVMMMPNGYNTLIGDKGVMLSGGQRQRVNLAQIFLKKPEIMIMDEATSALDTKSEQYINNSIEKLAAESTSIIIAHRLSTIRNADKVIVLDKGRIIEEGNWESLMKAKGVFSEMVNLQFFSVENNEIMEKEIALK